MSSDAGQAPASPAGQSTIGEGKPQPKRGECSGKDFRTFAQLTGKEGDHTGPPRGGVLALPLSYSIALTGGLFSLGSLFFGGEEELPWIAWVAGIAAGGLAYGLSAALD